MSGLARGSVVFLACVALSTCDSAGPKENALPILTDVSPDTLAVGVNGATLTLTGSDFAGGARVRWNQEDRPTSYVSATVITVALTAADLANSGSGKVSVINPPPGGGASGELTVQIRFGLPVLTSVTPNKVTALQKDTVEITATGSGFTTRSRILWNGLVFFETRYVSPTQLTARLGPGFFATPGTAKLSVVNPSPGGGSSAAVDFSVENPTPTITGLAPDSALSGGAAFNLIVNGEGFATGAVVRWNGADRQTTVLSATQLRAAITAADIANAGIASVVVVNPSPSAGASAAATFRIKQSPPRITLSSPTAIQAGSSFFTLTLSGSNFDPSAAVLWNGAPRQTIFVNSTTIRANIGGDDLRQPGTAQLQVRNPDPSGVSGSYPFPIYTLTTLISFLKEVPLRTNHIVWDSKRNRIYASVPGSVPIRANTITIIDPATGALGASLIVGSEPNRLAISDDQRYLYVTLNGASLVVRVDLESFTKDLEIALPSAGSSGINVGEDIEAIPGSPRSFAVSLQNNCCSPRHQGVAIYDDAVRRPDMTQGHTGSNRIAVLASTPGYLYGYNNETTEYGFRRIAISASGLKEESVVGGITGFDVDIEADGDRVFSTSGVVMDAVNMIRVGSVPSTGVVAPDVKNGRVHYLSGPTLVTYHSHAFARLGQAPYAGQMGALSMIRYGSDGLAIRTAPAVVLIRTQLAGF
jgi:hypothetical protein